MKERIIESNKNERREPVSYMKRSHFFRCITAFPALFLLISIFPITQSANAQTVPQLTLGVEQTETFVGAAYYMSFTASEDGYYSIDLNTIWGSDPDNWYVPPFSAYLYSKDSTVVFEYIPGEWYSRSVKDADNKILNRHEFRTEAFLHKGDYIIGIRAYYAKDTTNAKVTVKAERQDAVYGQDSEPNATAATAIPATSDGVFRGYLGGYYETGEKDMADWFSFTVPSAGAYPLYIMSDAESEGKKDKHGQIKCEIYDAKTKSLLKQVSSSFSAVDNLFTASEDISFSEAGDYYLAVKFVSENSYGNNRNFSAYNISLSGVKGSSSNSLTLTATATALGVKLTWSPSINPGGYRVFRDGVALNSSPVYGGSYVDITTESNKTYSYAVAPFDAGASVSQSSNASASVTTGEVEVMSGAKGFILMQIDKETMTVNENEVEIDPGRGTTPIIQNGRTMVPIRAIIEAMGGTVQWDEADQRVTLESSGHTVIMWLDQKDILVDGVSSAVDVAPVAINSRTMLPVRFVVENVGCAIEWIGSTQEIIIVY